MLLPGDRVLCVVFQAGVSFCLWKPPDDRTWGRTRVRVRVVSDAFVSTWAWCEVGVSTVQVAHTHMGSPTGWLGSKWALRT